MKSLILLVAVVLVGGCASGWVSNPSDPQNVIVEKAIPWSLDKLKGELTKADLEKVTRLVLAGCELTELPKGLEKLTQLTHLYLNGNQLTDVKGLERLSHPNKLQDLDAPPIPPAKRYYR